ncbi:hypothetical protein CMQ_305 [Grosmannia clavigera kw1407]|uniref:Uncharacterized protein n=1 Tax=Grosmannia clavigera (strain kw1407 / UAMH 11150) TaxID=655863 RepID=F0XR23_GROCL|nr:uncharacterized protein CMQ_305 [Grosmannia clavigera kw1407]EFW99987.1 hypothetical protein CMQ_305 [Grosmannia clavigera kw1407]
MAAALPSDPRSNTFFSHLRAGDTYSLYRWTISAKNTAEEASRRHELMASLPSLMFSELLRCLDPFAVSEHCDYVGNVAISDGMTRLTPLGSQVDQYGIRLVYTSLFRELQIVCALRQEAQLSLLFHDYIVLLRYAGATSDTVAAKRIWREMEEEGFIEWRQSDLYREFVRARFLTDTLYAQQDPFRLRVRPVNLHRQKLTMYRPRLDQLDHLRQGLERYRVQRTGQNPNQPDYAEHLTRILRKTKPVNRLYRMVSDLGIARDERLLAAFMVALGRTGSLTAMAEMLAHHWEIIVTWDKATSTVTVSGGAGIPPESPMRPSVVLLEAVVQAYCASGAVACALQVMDHLSRRYDIAIPQHLWFSLLSWTYVMTSKPAATEWRAAGFPEHALGPAAVQLVWTAMTSAPYNVQPGFAQYDVLIKTRIWQRKLSEALRLMREARRMYETQLGEYEAAVLEYAETARQGVGRSTAARRLNRAGGRKWYMWYCLQTWCRAILKRTQPRGVHDVRVVQGIPALIDEFRPFVPYLAQYHITTGFVQLREPDWHPRRMVHQTVYLPALRPHAKYRRHRGSSRGSSNFDNDGEGGPVVVDVGDKWHEKRLIPGLLRRRVAWVHGPGRRLPDLRALGPTTSREWLVQEFA